MKANAFPACIVIAWALDDVEFLPGARVDLGERPKTRPIKTAHAVCWLRKGSADDYAKAREYAATLGHATVNVYCYAPSVTAKPLEMARAAILAEAGK